MPNRIIRESLLDSPRYAGLTIEARLLFVHLLLLADDFGCIGVSETFLRRRAFYDSPSGQKIAKLLHEMVDVDLIRTYEYDRGVYAFIPRFRQRLQRNTLRHPKPPIALLHDDDDAIEKFSKIKDNSSIPTVPQPLPNRSPTDEGKRSEGKRRKSIGAADMVARFEVTEKMSDWAVQAGLHPDKVMSETRKMFDHHMSKENRFVDWNAAWRTWIGKAIEYAR